MESKIETWIAAADLPNYEVSSLGRLRRSTPGPSTFAGRIIPGSPEKQRKGYLRANVMRGGRTVHVSIHRLVCATFHGPAPSASHHVAHINGNNQDNRPENLRWATPLENEADKLAHGTRAVGSRHGCSKLEEKDIAPIREMVERGVSQRSVARQYGVSQVSISKIARRKLWAHVAAGGDL